MDDDDTRISPDENTVIVRDDDTVIVRDENTVIVRDDDTVIVRDENTVIAPDDDTVISADDDTVIVRDDDTVIQSPGTDRFSGPIKYDSVVEPASTSGPAKGRNMRIPLCVAAGMLLAALAYLVYILIAEPSADRHTETPTEMAEAIAVAVSAPAPLSEAEISALASRDNSACPLRMDDGLTMTGCSYSGGRLGYRFDCSARYFDYISANTQHWATLMTDQMLDTPSGPGLVAAAKERGLEITYTYRNERGQTIALAFDPSSGLFTP